MRSPVAVLASSCEFAQARTPQQLWQLALHGRQCFRRMPPQRLPMARYLRSDDDPDGLYPIEAALIEGCAFDRERFLVPLSAYQGTDLSHWLALDLADRALAELPAGWDHDQALARDEMRVFDARSNGFWPGEGGGCVLLGNAAVARQRGWSPRGWVCGTGIATDGQGGLTPSPQPTASCWHSAGPGRQPASTRPAPTMSRPMARARPPAIRLNLKRCHACWGPPPQAVHRWR